MTREKVSRVARSLDSGAQIQRAFAEDDANQILSHGRKKETATFLSSRRTVSAASNPVLIAFPAL
jgi:hypothetical protein